MGEPASRAFFHQYIFPRRAFDEGHVAVGLVDDNPDEVIGKASLY